MTMMLRALAIVGVSVSAAALATAPALARTPDNTLVYATSLAQVISLDPHQNSDATSTEIMANIYDWLLRATADGQLEPQLATSWEVGPDAITFMLDENATFDSGRKVTADDVVWSFIRLMKLNQAVATIRELRCLHRSQLLSQPGNVS